LAAAPLLEHCGELYADEFGPVRLKQLRETIIAGKKHARESVNAIVGRIKRIFAWAVSEELIPGTIHHALMTVKGMKRGRADVREGKKRLPVAEADVLATLPELSPLLQAMVQFQWWTGARSSSICRAKAEQFDRSEAIWLWQPRHKNEHLGLDLTVPIGPKAQAIILPHLDRAARTGGYLFNPRTQRRNKRYGKRYTSQSYRQAVQRAVVRVNKGRAEARAKMASEAERKSLPDVPNWSPHQIRHARGKLVRAKHGLEGSKAALGHETLEMAQHYAERNLELAKQIAREMG
jgi:integrase